MTTTRVRMMTAFAAALLLALPAAALAGEVKRTAKLFPTQENPRAYGQAVWTANPRAIALNVQVYNVPTTDLALVFINGRFVGLMDIIDGSGELHLSTHQRAVVPHVEAGSTVEITRLEDDELILYGKFRGQ